MIKDKEQALDLHQTLLGVGLLLRQAQNRPLTQDEYTVAQAAVTRQLAVTTPLIRAA